MTEHPSQEVLVGKFVWFDLVTDDPDQARRFYADLFGWQIEEGDGGYYLGRNLGVPIAGLTLHENREEEAGESLWLATLSVADVDAAVSLVKSRGGQVVVEAAEVEERGRLAVVRDPAGAPVVLARARGGDPPDGRIPPGSWMWTDLFTHDSEASIRFYGELVGYRTKRVDLGGGDEYELLLSGRRPRAGVVEVPWTEVEPNWLPYLRVEDVDQAVSHALSLGAELAIREDDVAILLDPTGAAFGVQRVPRRVAEGGER
jgi:predicted enzyme related to lactoylglutathione lyase